jgi:Cd2+/Zn2+-exporting ATPase
LRARHLDPRHDRQWPRGSGAQGILIKGGVYLEQGHKLAVLALDKTGTITHGKPALTDTVQLDQMGGIDSLRVATSLAARSDHPVSFAIAEAGRKSGIALLDVTCFAALPGRGVKGTIGGVDYLLGNHRLIHETGVCSPAIETQLAQLEAQGKTVIVLTDGNEPLILLAVADTIKDSSRVAIRNLHELGIETVMLTGDNSRTAAAIAQQVGIDKALGDQLPEDKLRRLNAISAMAGLSAWLATASTTHPHSRAPISGLRWGPPVPILPSRRPTLP